MSQLKADVCIQAIGCDRVENLVIKFGAMSRLVGIGYVLTQVVDAYRHSRAIDGLGDADGVGDFCTGDETSGDALSDGRSLGKIA